MQYNEMFSRSADPVTTEYRFARLMEDPEISSAMDSLPDEMQADVISVIGISRFLFHFLCRHPEAIRQFSRPGSFTGNELSDITTMDQLRLFKYRELLNITRMDINSTVEYDHVLMSLSRLADLVVEQVFRLTLGEREREIFERHFCTFALGKLGAGELNYSSDIDLIFVCSNPDDVAMEVYEYQKILQDGIRLISSQLEQRTVDGFLYRVDLKLRPWGKSGPLVISIDETENYYAASSEAWERFAWLRARPMSGSLALGNDLKQRLQPFVYRRSLSLEDLDRFIEIKNEMFRVRRKKGYWNVKVGEGGIRDIEFFIQMLQIVNAGTHPYLQTTGTMKVLAGVQQAGLVSENEAREIRHSYIFLRRLENRLQMIDEQQTHELPEEPALRTIIARSLGIPGETDDEILNNFESELFANRTIAQSYFERILPQKNTQS
jgi:[glutamine synthetase] adenylyltransferase / [glutamine synthetase]-adenylyl-L-tyrosine phosphorylase